jgi:hypothetical protein
LKPKKIYIPKDVEIQNWVDDNRNEIMQSLYDNVFEFVKSKKDTAIVLQVISGHITRGRVIDSSMSLNVDFIMIKDDILTTIDKLIYYMEEVEEYEKCAKLLNLKKSIKL